MRSKEVVQRRSAVFAAEPRSVGGARQLLLRALDDAGRPEWADAAALALSELVTNVVLHAHTAFEVVVEVGADRLQVEVRDGDPALPAPAQNQLDATTGRGLALVAAVTAAWGTRRRGRAGKAVWFTLGGAEDPGRPAPDLLAAWSLDEPPPPAREVRLVDLPAGLWLAAREHHEALLRELVLYLAEHDDVTADLALAQGARGHVLPALQQVVAAPEVPEPPGPVTLPLWLPRDLRAAFVELRRALRVAEHLAGNGRLLVRPGRRDVVAVREWLLGEVVDQLAGAAPTPWRALV